MVMQEEKVRQCKVFVVLMQGEDSCSERSDAAAAPAWKQVCRAEMGSTFYSPLPLCFFLNGTKEAESSVDLQHSYVNKSSSVPLPPKVILPNLLSWFTTRNCKFCSHYMHLTCFIPSLSPLDISREESAFIQRKCSFPPRPPCDRRPRTTSNHNFYPHFVELFILAADITVYSMHCSTL